METEYFPGQKILLKGTWANYPATIVSVTEDIIEIHCDGILPSTSLSVDQFHSLQHTGEIELVT